MTMLLLIIYVLLVSCLFGVAALAAEHTLTRWRLPRRTTWTAALLLSLAWPTYAVLTKNGESPLPSSLARSPAAATNGTETTTPNDGRSAGITPLADLNWSRWAGLDDWPRQGGSSIGRLDPVLTAVWVASSIGALGILILASISLRLAARRWHSRRIGQRDVLISERLGPAMFGIVNPRVVLPRWLLDAGSETLDLVLCHESEHIHARDQLLLTVAMLLVALAPWNPFLWWQLTRVRDAIETDCDARVLSRGTDPTTYARTLLAVNQRRSVAPMAAIALIEPASRLERRIRQFLEPSRTSRAFVFAGGLAASVLVAAATLADAPFLTRHQDASDSLTESERDSGGETMNARALTAAILAATGVQAAEVNQEPPEGWNEFLGSGWALGPGPSSLPKSCQAGIDETLAAGGQPNMTVRCAGIVPGFNGLNQRFPADQYRGKRVRFAAYLRSEGIADAGFPGIDITASSGELSETIIAGIGGLYFRIGENPALHLVRDDMADRGLRGDIEWAPYEIVAEVPANAVGITIGFWMQGRGQIWISNIEFGEVGENVPVTTLPIDHGNGPANLKLR